MDEQFKYTFWVEDGQGTFEFYGDIRGKKEGDLIKNEEFGPVSIQIIWIDHDHKYVLCCGDDYNTHLTADEIKKEQKRCEEEKKHHNDLRLFFNQNPVYYSIRCENIPGYGNLCHGFKSRPFFSCLKSCHRIKLPDYMEVIELKTRYGYFIKNKKTNKILFYTCSATKEEAVIRGFLIHQTVIEISNKLE